VRQLESRGFVRTSDEVHEAAFGNRLIVFKREPVEIRLVKDRGQWAADLIADGWPGRERLPFPLFHGFALEELPDG
jgi:hypothetical protein